MTTFKSYKLLTPYEVAELLKCSVQTVYKNKKRLCGFNPAGLKLLRFQEEVIIDIIQGREGMAVRISDELPEVHGIRVQDQKRVRSSRGHKKKRGEGWDQKEFRHGF